MDHNKKLLLVATDNKEARELYDYLVEIGFELLPIVNTYNEAVALIAKELPELILLSIELTEIDKTCLDVANYVSQTYIIPIIYLTCTCEDQLITDIKTTHPITCVLNVNELYKKQLVIDIDLLDLPKDTLNKFKAKALKIVEITMNKKSGLPNIPKNLWEKNHIEKLIIFSNIAYIQSINKAKNNYVLIWFQNCNDICFLARGSLKRFINWLPPLQFIRIHNSTIINPLCVTDVQLPNKLYIGDKEFNIGHYYRNKVLLYFKSIKK